MQFKLDENLSTDLVVLLKGAGHGTTTAIEQQLGGVPDSQVAAAIRAEGRALLTLDLDFADIRAYPPNEYAGLIVLRLARQDKRIVLRVVERILPLLDTEPLSGHLWIVDEHSLRIRGGTEAKD